VKELESGNKEMRVEYQSEISELQYKIADFQAEKNMSIKNEMLSEDRMKRLVEENERQA
jgi:hypothetical protein